MSTVVEVEGGYEIHMQRGVTVEVNNAKGKKGDDGSDGTEIELQKTSTHIQWRYVGGSWTNLVALLEITGSAGRELEIQVTATHIQTRLTGGTWTNLIALSELKGDKGDPGTTNHSLLLNLNNDDHTQYLNLNGRVGGQTISGGTATGENLTLMSTNHATKGSILFGDSRYNEATNRFVLGTATGTGRINLPDAGTTAADGIQFGTEGSIFRGTLGFLTIRSGIGHVITNGIGQTLMGIYLGSIEANRSFGIVPSTLTGSSATSALSISQTWNTTGNPTALLMDITNTASGANSRLIDLRVNGVSQFRVDRANGLTTVSNTLNAGNINTSNALYLADYQSGFRSTGSGVIRLMNASENDFNRLQFGGTTSSFPSLKRNGAALEVRLADDSNFGAIQSLYQRFGSGSPEGVVTAPMGAIYHNTDGGANTSLYVKESGTGNTGWIGK